ncbi:MAG: GGDEF domain-containing protein [Phycisphaerales bacterium]|nr:GGDEF domain-containing protein [Phycisphaerales bacterium]
MLQANHKLSDAATRDPLTGLRNRRAMTHRLDSLLRQASASFHPLSILMVDIDHFKLVNDQYGHPMGDRVLQQVAEILSAGARHGDLVVRYGGEEFLLILPDCAAESSMTLARRLMHAVQNHAFDHGKVTISIGVATSTPHLLNKDRLIQQADAALYHGKQNGRNCAFHFNDLPPEMTLPMAA